MHVVVKISEGRGIIVNGENIMSPNKVPLYFNNLYFEIKLA